MKSCANPNCQADNPFDANYCHMCGQKLYENKYKGYIIHYKHEILCGTGALGVVLLIIGAFGSATITNAVLGSVMLCLSIFLFDKKSD